MHLLVHFLNQKDIRNKELEILHIPPEKFQINLMKQILISIPVLVEATKRGQLLHLLETVCPSGTGCIMLTAKDTP